MIHNKNQNGSVHSFESFTDALLHGVYWFSSYQGVQLEQGSAYKCVSVNVKKPA
jgi:hypothetical protein